MDKLRALVDYDDDEDLGSKDAEKLNLECKIVTGKVPESLVSREGYGQGLSKISTNPRINDKDREDKKVNESSYRKSDDKRSNNSHYDKDNETPKKHPDNMDNKRSSRNDRDSSSSKSRSSHKYYKRSRSRSREDKHTRRKDDHRKSYRSEDKHHRDGRKEDRDSIRSDRDRDRRNSKSDRDYENSRSRYSRDSKSSDVRKTDHRDSKDYHDVRSFRESRDSSRTQSGDSSAKDVHSRRYDQHSRESSTGNHISEPCRDNNAAKPSSLNPSTLAYGDFVEPSIGQETVNSLPSSSNLPSQPTFPPSVSPLISTTIMPATSSIVPRYYKQSTFNATKYAIQEEKKKLLWSSTKSNDSEPNKTPKVWHGLQFSGAQGQQMTEKFLKLMGSKTTSTADNNEPQDSMVKYQENLFKDLDKQYSMARMSTHTHRGIGLGFSSHSSPK